MARGIKGVSNFGSKLRLADTAEGDDRGELGEEEFARLLKEDKLGLTPRLVVKSPRMPSVCSPCCWLIRPGCDLAIIRNQHAKSDN